MYVGRSKRKCHVAGFIQGQILEVSTWIERKGTVAIGNHRAFTRTSGDRVDQSTRSIIAVHITCQHTRRHGRTIFRRRDAFVRRNRSIVHTSHCDCHGSRVTHCTMHVGRCKGKCHIPGFTGSQILEPGPRIERESTIHVIGHRAITRNSGDRVDQRTRSIVGINVSTGKRTTDRRTIFHCIQRPIGGSRSIVYTSYRHRHGSRVTHCTMHVGRRKGKHHVASLIQGQILEVSTRIERESTVAIGNHRAFTWNSGDRVD